MLVPDAPITKVRFQDVHMSQITSEMDDGEDMLTSDQMDRKAMELACSFYNGIASDKLCVRNDDGKPVGSGFWSGRAKGAPPTHPLAIADKAPPSNLATHCLQPPPPPAATTTPPPMAQNVAKQGSGAKAANQSKPAKASGAAKARGRPPRDHSDEVVKLTLNFSNAKHNDVRFFGAEAQTIAKQICNISKDTCLNCLHVG